MTLGDALRHIGVWSAALAVGDSAPWKRVCGDAARKAGTPQARLAWSTLARCGRQAVARRLNAAGIRI